MAKTRKNYGINGHKAVLKSLKNVMKATGQKYSIRVGIIGDKAYHQNKDSGLTNADLGAIHEFGATINVTPRMRAFLNYMGVHLKKDTTQITIPERSFLREVLLNKEIQEYIYNAAELTGKKDFDEIIVQDMSNGNASILMNNIANIIGAKALEMVQTAFLTGGYPNTWAPISEITKQHRTGSPGNPPLTDTGDLRDSMSVEVKKVK